MLPLSCWDVSTKLSGKNLNEYDEFLSTHAHIAVSLTLKWTAVLTEHYVKHGGLRVA